FIKAHDMDIVISLILPFLILGGSLIEDMDLDEKNWGEKVFPFYRRHLGDLQDIVELTVLVFKAFIHFDDEAMKVLQEEQIVEVLQVLTDQLIHLYKFTKDEIKNRIKATQKETGIRGKKLFMPIRVAATGQTHGPELPMAMELLGKDIVITRLNEVLEQLGA